ncbi:MAG: arsenite methyltransferase [Oligoflexia bacterium]|nr:arsenite methyltransferase [Oligoflexia bacterium]
MRSDTDPKDEIRQEVRKSYAQVATGQPSGIGCCAPSTGTEGTCCSTADYSTRLGYTQEDLDSVPQGADMGLGCGNPRAIASLKPGEVVLDLGCGGGFDCFLAAREVGATGRVIGVDMTPEMISKARANAKKANAAQVEFRLGEIEHLPVADSSIDVIISNCVINLSPDKEQVFREALRVLKPGGRLAISDIVAAAELPEEIKADLKLHSACVSGATEIGELRKVLKAAGFVRIVIAPKDESREFIKDWAPGRKLEDIIVSAAIEAEKPAPGCCGTGCC